LFVTKNYVVLEKLFQSPLVCKCYDYYIFQVKIFWTLTPKNNVISSSSHSYYLVDSNFNFRTIYNIASAKVYRFKSLQRCFHFQLSTSTLIINVNDLVWSQLFPYAHQYNVLLFTNNHLSILSSHICFDDIKWNKWTICQVSVARSLPDEISAAITYSIITSVNEMGELVTING
jgi:hypothetical protein